MEKKLFFEKKAYKMPEMKVVQLENCDIICTSDIRPQSDDNDLNNIEYGGSF